MDKPNKRTDNLMLQHRHHNDVNNNVLQEIDDQLDQVSGTFVSVHVHSSEYVCCQTSYIVCTELLNKHNSLPTSRKCCDRHSTQFLCLNKLRSRYSRVLVHTVTTVLNSDLGIYFINIFTQQNWKVSPPSTPGVYLRLVTISGNTQQSLPRIPLLN